jgi:uncharacterized protein (TIRG00374 family)
MDTTAHPPTRELTGTHPVVEDEPPPRRVRRPVDAVRLVALGIALAGFLLVASVATGTTTGLDEDIDQAAGRLPGVLAGLVNLLASGTLLLVPVAVAVALLLRREVRLLTDALLAAILAALATAVLAAGLRAGAPPELLRVLTGTSSGDGTTPVTPGIAVLSAYLTGAGLTGQGRDRLAMASWTLTAVTAIGLIGAGTTTAAAALTGFLLGRMSGITVRFVRGVPNVRPYGEEVLAAVRRAGLSPVELRRVESTDEDTYREYAVIDAAGRRFDARVLDRDRLGAGWFYRFYRLISVSGPAARRTVLSLRQAVDREALLCYAVAQAGVNSPRLVAVADAGPNAALLLNEHLHATPLEALPAERVDDAVLARLWRQVTMLHSHRVAHRGLAGAAVQVDADGQPWLTELRNGEVAATDLQLRLDVAQLVATTGLVVGPDRAVAAAVTALGADEAAAAVPVLQPVALNRTTRARLRKERALLPALRKGLLGAAPHAEPTPVRLERLRPRTVLSLVLGSVAAYLVLTQLGQVDVVELLQSADWVWVAAALVISLGTYLGAALSLQAFTPGTLRFLRTLWVQVASSFVNLVTPPAVGNVALNARYLQRQDIPTGIAVASVGLTQVSGFVVTLLLLIGCGLATGANTESQLVPSRTALIIFGVVVAAALLVLLVPAVRQRVLARVMPTLRNVLPRLLDMVQEPKRLAAGLGGNLLISVCYALALDACLLAFGASVPVLTVVIVYLAGSAVGSLAPTPGGLGAVEAAISAGLTAAGVEGGVAISATLLFRTLTYWLRVPPGWVAFQALQRRQII